jgi:EAL domain-containing protein (putative c-di-GMP-specific phosphodiesterase class I)
MVEASIGMAVFPEHGETADDLMRRADIAMYACKRSGGGCTVYHPEQDQHSQTRLALVGELRSAIEGGQLLLHYQPKVSFGGRHTVGVEALVRWKHPQRGMIPPDQFIAPAEQTGLIKPLTRWVLENALGQVSRWLVGGIPLDLAVNLSARSLHDLHLPDEVFRTLAASGVPAARLTLEITESAIMADPTRAAEVLHRLAAGGVRLAIDDFGVGYTSIGQVKRLPVNEIKVDKIFVAEMTTNADDAAIVRSIIELAHSLELTVTAEGIETEAVWSRLAELGCDAAQGYYLSRPQPAEALAHWMHESPWGRATPPP